MLKGLLVPRSHNCNPQQIITDPDALIPQQRHRPEDSLHVPVKVFVEEIDIVQGSST